MSRDVVLNLVLEGESRQEGGDGHCADGSPGLRHAGSLPWCCLRGCCAGSNHLLLPAWMCPVGASTGQEKPALPWGQQSRWFLRGCVSSAFPRTSRSADGRGSVPGDSLINLS